MGKGLLPPPEKARPLKKTPQTLKGQLGLPDKGRNRYDSDSEWYKTGPGAGKYVWDTSRTPPLVDVTNLGQKGSGAQAG